MVLINLQCLIIGHQGEPSNFPTSVHVTLSTKNVTNLRVDSLRISDQMKVFVEMLGNHRKTTKYNKEVEVESKSITSERAWRLLSKAGAAPSAEA